MFERHEIIFCDGVEAESFDPGLWAVRTLTPEAREELECLFPEIANGELPGNFHQYRTVSAHEARVLRG
jgi:hypothetical protein